MRVRRHVNWMLFYNVVHVTASTSGSGINLNLQNGNSGIQSSMKGKATKSPLVGGIISLDLAGKVNIHVSSPKNTDDESRPLLRWGNGDESNKDKCPTPSIFIGTKYDFGQFWYGARRLLTTLSWGKRYLQTESKDGKISMLTNIRTEIGLQNPKDYSLELEFQFPRRNTKRLQSLMSVRLENVEEGKHACATLSTFVHPRLQFISRTFLSQKDVSHKGFSSRIPEGEINWSEGSWIPDFKMTPTGKVLSSSALGFNRQSDGLNRVGFRLTARRQINWNLFGLVSDVGNDVYERNDTAVRLELSYKTNHGQTLTSISAEAAAERINSTMQYCLKQERFI